MSRNVVRLLVGVLLAAVIVVGFLERDRLRAADLHAWVESLGPAAAIAFLAAYAVAPALFLPGSILTLVGGAAFGPVYGGLLSLVGATVGATFAFLIARYLAGDWVEKRASGKLQQIKDGVEREGWRFVAFVRLVPVFPFNLINYALGLTRISVATFAVTSFVAMAPGALAYAYLGHVGGAAATGQSGWIRQSLIAVAVIATLAFVPSLVRRWRRPTTISSAGAPRASRG